MAKGVTKVLPTGDLNAHEEMLACTIPTFKWEIEASSLASSMHKSFDGAVEACKQG